MGMNTEKSKFVISRCCVCARERVDGQWLAKIIPGDTAEDPGNARVSHTYCPECLAAVSPNRRTSGRACLLRKAVVLALLAALPALAHPGTDPSLYSWFFNMNGAKGHGANATIDAQIN